MKNLKKLVVGVLAVAICFATSTVAKAEVTIDENGTGFVGKGDVQAVFDWNNAQLQENAIQVRFRLGESTTYHWICLNPQGKETGASDQQTTVDSEVAVDARKNKQGQVTGFYLNGFGDTEQSEIGACSTNWTLKPDSLTSVASGEGSEMLQVSVNGDDWFDLE